MPWQAVQFLRRTSHTGPSGRCTLGRVALPPTCAAKGKAETNNAASPVANLDALIELQRQRLRAGSEVRHHPDLLASHIVLGDLIDAVLVEHTQQHVRGAL